MRCDEDASEQWAQRGGELEEDAVPGDGVVEEGLRDELGQVAVAGGASEGADDAADGEEDVEPDDGGADEAGVGEDAGDEGEAALGESDDLFAFEAIGDLAGDEGEEEDGQGAGEAGVTELERVVGALVDFPADGGAEDLQACAGGEEASGVPAVVGDAEGSDSVVLLAGRGVVWWS